MGLIRSTRPLAIAFAFVLAAQPAWAQKQTPKVKEVVPAEGPPGANILLKGNNFSDKRDLVEVLADGKKCIILECGLETIRFFMPANPPLPPGPVKIEVKINGESCTTSFKVLDLKDKKQRDEDMKRRDAERQKYEGASTYEDPFKQNEALLSITKFEVVTAGNNPTVVVEGKTGLPKDFFLTANFGVVGQTEQLQVAAHKVKIVGDTWKTTFGIPPAENWQGKTLLAGKYYVHVMFEMAKQSPLDLKKVGWPEKLSEGEKVAREIVWKKEIKDVGSPDDMKKQDEELRAHYVELARQTTDLFEALERAYAAAGKSYFKKASGGSVDEDEWAKWVVSRGIGSSDDDMKKIKGDNRFMKGAYFNADAWQLWVESDLFKKLAEAFKRHEDVKAKYVGSRDKRVEVEGDYLLSIVLKLSQTYSSEIYAKNKLQLPDTLRAPKDFTGGLDSVAVSRGHFENHRKILLERLGLSNFDPGKKDEKKPDDKKPEAPKPDDKKPDAPK